MLLAGVGFLLPYNSFITDVDYLHHKFPGGSRPLLPRGPSRSAPPRTPNPAPRRGLRGNPGCELLRDGVAAPLGPS